MNILSKPIDEIIDKLVEHGIIRNRNEAKVERWFTIDKESFVMGVTFMSQYLNYNTHNIFSQIMEFLGYNSLSINILKESFKGYSKEIQPRLTIRVALEKIDFSQTYIIFCSFYRDGEALKTEDLEAYTINNLEELNESAVKKFFKTATYDPFYLKRLLIPTTFYVNNRKMIDFIPTLNKIITALYNQRLISYVQGLRDGGRIIDEEADGEIDEDLYDDYDRLDIVFISQEYHWIHVNSDDVVDEVLSKAIKVINSILPSASGLYQGDNRWYFMSKYGLLFFVLYVNDTDRNIKSSGTYQPSIEIALSIVDMKKDSNSSVSLEEFKD